MPSDLEASLRQTGFELLAVDLQHARLAAHLPPFHKDPFDRMVVAQAMNRGALLVTSDGMLAAYGLEVLLI